VNCQTKPCSLTVNFTTKKGMAISGTRTVIGSYTEGQKIKVQYNPDSPSNFTIAKLSSKAFGTIWLSLGLFILVVSLIYYLLTR
jgi:predicted NUDIX family NTP pyrophosphohydrolase